jgi:hypothetical protein
MSERTPDKVAMYRICELKYGKDRGFAGYVGYKSTTPARIANLEAELVQFITTEPDATKKPKRKLLANAALDPSLSIVAEDGIVRYIFALDAESRSTFDTKNPILPIPIPGVFKAEFIHDIQPIMVDGKCSAVSFVINCAEVKRSGLGQKISTAEHKTAVRIPFCFNLIDDELGVPQWAIDDHRYEPDSHPTTSHDNDHHDDHDHDHDEEPDNHFKDVSNHGGAHPPTSSNAAMANIKGDGRTHGGVHPPGASSYVVVELP